MDRHPRAKRSNPERGLDCFASLAMTGVVQTEITKGATSWLHY